MMPATRSACRRAVTLLASLGLSHSAPAKLLEFNSAFGSFAPPGTAGSATFTSVVTAGELDEAAVLPVRAFASGFFTGQFRLGAAATLDNTDGEDGVLVGLTRDPALGGWTSDWLLQARSEGGGARITDVAISRDGEIFVTGTFRNNVRFELRPPGNALTFVSQPLVPEEGFVARADPFGNWIGAFPVRDMLPSSLALNDAGDIFLTGPPVLARRYARDGAELWSVPAPAEVLTLRHIVAESNQTRRSLYVLGSINRDSVPGEVDQDVFVARLSQNGNPPDWITPIASRGGAEHPGGLGLGPLGRLRVSFSSDNSANVTVGPAPLAERPPGRGRHAHLLFLGPDGSLLRDNLLGVALAAGSAMETSDLAIDPAGNAHVAVSFAGPFSFEGVPRGGQQDAGVVTVDAAGLAFRFTASNGPATNLGNAVAAAGRDLQILVGGLRGADAEQFGPVVLQAAPEERAYVAALEPAPDQNAYLLVSQLNEPVDLMEQRITQRGGEVYRTLALRNEGVTVVAAYLTGEQLQDLQRQFTIFLDQELVPNGTLSPADWALESLNTAPLAAADPFSYTYPETCHPTVLYLIDSAIDTSSGYFDANANLTFGPSTLVRATGDPLVSSKFDHGTTLMSMIAGPGHGAAQGTPVTVINYDIYPDGSTARLSALVEAIGLANSDKALNHPYDPAVYCIASSADDPGVTSPTLQPAVDYAVGPSVYATVVLSAGNTSGDAADYTPSFLGSLTGVVCAGAVDVTGAQVADTRGGAAVDIWAPGDKVAAADTSGTSITTGGTSAATAFTTAAALIYLSANPTAIPAGLETALVTTYAQPGAVGQLLSIPPGEAPGFTAFADWTWWHGLADPGPAGNDDGDPWSNEEEYVWGLDPNRYDAQGSLVTLSYDSSTTTLTYEFPLSCHLYQPSALTTHILRDGSTLIVERSSDLLAWEDITSTVTLVEVGHNDGQATLSFDYGLTSPRCFLRVRVQ